MEITKNTGEFENYIENLIVRKLNRIFYYYFMCNIHLKRIKKWTNRKSSRQYS
jgi:hypothetical protein